MTVQPDPVSVLLPPHGSSVGEARRFVARALTDHGLDHLVDDAALATSELVANAVLHARTTVTLRLTVEHGHVRVEVADGSATLPVLRGYGSHATTGRGLALVAALAAALGTESRPDGKVVWFTLPTVPAVPTQHGAADEAGVPPVAVAPGAGAPGGVAVLGGLPVALWLAARQHEDAALRELALYEGTRLASTLEAWEWYGEAMTAHAELNGAIERAVADSLGELVLAGPPASSDVARQAVLTVEVEVAPDLPRRLERLLEVLDDAEARAAGGELLIRPAPSELVALRDWRCRQVIAQAAGTPATAWSA